MVHSELLMLLSLVLALLLGGATRWRILRRSVAVIALFVGSVTLLYALFGAAPEALWLINLRALAITQLSFTLSARVNLHGALGFSPTLQLLYTLSLTQITLLRQLLFDYRDALRSRGARLERSTLAPLLESLFDAMLRRSEAQQMALRARGVLGD